MRALQVGAQIEGRKTYIGAGLPAKSVNDNAGCLVPRGALRCFAGKPAPTKTSAVCIDVY
ncbi:hypothetical protein GDV60_15955 [Pseudomonas sp. DTU12.1]|nr:hypothetical protein GDV60_15955 [Pseudomonas sp. DTU12.1]